MPYSALRMAGKIAATSLLISGTALIFRDPRLPGTKYRRKLDAIDTDQITPAADCVSERLDTLDERWNAGSLRYLMPDFRQRVHRGETFVIAGEPGPARALSGSVSVASSVTPKYAAIANDHFVFTGRDDDDRQTGIGRAFAAHHGLKKPDYGAYGVVGIGVGSTTLGFGWATGYVGQGSDARQPGQRAITSFNRNWQNRMGVGGEGYLASPAVVAASALLGYMAPPSELGLRWDPEQYGV